MEDDLKGLPARARTVIMYEIMDETGESWFEIKLTKKKVLNLLKKRGALRPEDFKKIALDGYALNYGKRTHVEVLRWLGLLGPEDRSKLSDDDLKLLERLIKRYGRGPIQSELNRKRQDAPSSNG